MKSFKLLMALSVVLAPSGAAFGGPEIVVGFGNVPKEGRQLFSFAAGLYEKGDYYRAITEFSRFGDYYPQSEAGKLAGLFIAESYCAGQLWNDAVKTYGRFLSSATDAGAPGAPGAEAAEAANAAAYSAAQYRLYFSRIQKGDYAEAEKLYSEIEATPGHTWLEEARYLNVLSEFSKKEWQKSVDLMNGYLGKNPSSRYAEKYRALVKEVAEYKKIPAKYPATAGLCSALLPGAGQVYAKRPGDAVMALALTGVSLATALNCHRNNAEFGTLVFSLFTFSFYTANIYNAMNNANKFNDEAGQKFYRKVAETAREESVFRPLKIKVTEQGALLSY